MTFEQVAGTLVLIAVCLLTLAVYPLMTLYLRAIRAGVSVSFMDLVGMRLRRVPVAAVLEGLIQAKQAGMSVTVRELESHHLDGGNVERSIEALVRGNSRVTFAQVAAADLGGHDVSRMSADEIRKAAGQRPSAT